MHLQRTRFKKDIVAEFLIPEGGSDKVIILASGMPGYASKGEVVRFLVKKGYAVFNPRYRGTWESGGEFLAISPHQDILDIIDELPKGFTSAWDGERYTINPKEINIICSSFGGPAGLLVAGDERIHKVIAVSPVVDWNAESRKEPLDFLYTFVRQGFGEAYRFPKANWDKLATGTFYSPISRKNTIPGEKIWILHSEDDDIVLPESVKIFAKDTSCKLTMYKNGGHLGMSRIMKWPLWWKVKKFLKKP